MSVFIPRVTTDFTKEDIKCIMEENIGTVEHIDLVAKVSKVGNIGQIYNAAFIHFSDFYDTYYSNKFQKEVFENGETAKVYYDETTYWLVLANKSEKHNTHLNGRKLKINLEETKKINETQKQTQPQTPIKQKQTYKLNNDKSYLNAVVKNIAPLLNAVAITEQSNKEKEMEQAMKDEIEQQEIDFIIEAEAEYYANEFIEMENELNNEMDMVEETKIAIDRDIYNMLITNYMGYAY